MIFYLCNYLPMNNTYCNIIIIMSLKGHFVPGTSQCHIYVKVSCNFIKTSRLGVCLE